MPLFIQPWQTEGGGERWNQWWPRHYSVIGRAGQGFDTEVDSNQNNFSDRSFHCLQLLEFVYCNTDCSSVFFCMLPPEWLDLFYFNFKILNINILCKPQFYLPSLCSPFLTLTALCKTNLLSHQLTGCIALFSTQHKMTPTAWYSFGKKKKKKLSVSSRGFGLRFGELLPL